MNPATFCALSLALLRRRPGAPFCPFATSAQVEGGAPRDVCPSNDITRTHHPSAARLSLAHPGGHKSALLLFLDTPIRFRARGLGTEPSHCENASQSVSLGTTDCASVVCCVVLNRPSLPRGTVRRACSDIVDRQETGQTSAVCLQVGASQKESGESGPRRATEAAATACRATWSAARAPTHPTRGSIGKLALPVLLRPFAP